MFAQYEDRVVVTYEPSFFADAGEYGIFRLTDRFGVLDKDECTEDSQRNGNHNDYGVLEALKLCRQNKVDEQDSQQEGEHKA